MEKTRRIKFTKVSKVRMRLGVLETRDGEMGWGLVEIELDWSAKALQGLLKILSFIPEARRSC